MVSCMSVLEKYDVPSKETNFGSFNVELCIAVHALFEDKVGLDNDMNIITK